LLNIKLPLGAYIMTNIQIQHQQFENQKNMKALGYTTVITASVFLLLFLASWTIPQPPPPPVDEGIEVNLGNSETGLGDVPPQIPGEMSNAEHTTVAAPQTTQAAAETQPEVADNKEPDAPEVHTSPKPEVKKNPAKTENTTAKNNNDKPVVNTPPKVVKPKAVYAGGKSSGGTGNNADSYNNAKNQGIAGGTGDQGKPNGNPNSDSYTGNGGTGKGGIAITSGLSGRRVIGATRFEDSYKYGGVVYVNVTVDENGKVIAKSIKQGSPFADINAIALKKAGQLTFSKGTEQQSGTIQIKFENPKG
jgi:TonB family protein